MADRPLSQIWGALRPAPLKVQAGGTLPRRSTLHPWNVAAGSPTWILLEFPQSVTPLPPPLSPPYLRQESLLVHKSHHVFRANDHISPPLLPVPLSVLCQGRASSALGAGPRTPQLAVIGLACLGWRPERPAMCSPGVGEKKGQSRKGMWHRPTLSLISPLLGVPLGREDEPPTP